jgi:hypothetical protein
MRLIMLKNLNILLRNIKMMIKIMKQIYKEEMNKYTWRLNKQAWLHSPENCPLPFSGIELLQGIKANSFNQIVITAIINIKVRKE